MKILFKGPYPQNDGWGRASRDFIRALNLTKNNLSVIPIVLSDYIGHDIPEDIKKLEKENIPSPDIFIQHCLPSFMEPVPNLYNIGLCATETTNLKHTGWIDQINRLNMLWCWTHYEKENLIQSGVKIPIHNIPQPMNTAFFDKVNEVFDDERIESMFTFYFIGEWSERKNIDDTILAYWREFNRDENVRLILKVNLGNVSSDHLGKMIYDYLERLKQIYRLYDKSYSYPEILVITDYLNDEDIIKLHKTCNSFVTSSYGEATCIPLLNALYCNKTVICTEKIGADDPDLDIIRVKSNMVPCVCHNPPIPNLYSGWELWRKIDVLELQAAMRGVFNGSIRTAKQSERVRDKYSFKAVAGKITDVLSGLHLSKIR